MEIAPRFRDGGLIVSIPSASNGLIAERLNEYADILEQQQANLFRITAYRRSWLPVLHTMRDPWHFTELFSNTARAHELHRTGDWVVSRKINSDRSP